MKTKFFLDLEKVYNFKKEQFERVGKLFRVVESGSENVSYDEEFVNKELEKLGLEPTREMKLAFITRLVSLKVEPINILFKKLNFEKERIDSLNSKLYDCVTNFYTNEFNKLITFIEKERLLTPFYQKLIIGTHKIGLKFNIFFKIWQKEIIEHANYKLNSLYPNRDEALSFLNSQNLLDKSSGEVCERSYSALLYKDNKFMALPYIEAFKDEISMIIFEIESLRAKLLKLDEHIFFKKESYIKYFDTLKDALSETNRELLLNRWAEVDKIWMGINTPIQIAHPLEYYEDIYRHSVAPEWDLRIINPMIRFNYDVSNGIKEFYKDIFSTFDTNSPIYNIPLSNINKTQTYIGTPLLYYGSEFCGLFSAQVVPNDEGVSSKFGKKIFAYADMILQSIRARPFLKISKEIFPQWFLDFERELVFKKSELWYEVYNITTIGHEFGHILFMDENSEALMNISGEFKNVEEFKATTGGILSYPKDDLYEYILVDSLKRAVSMLIYRESSDIEPYYCEALIYLTLFFRSGVVKFDGKKLEIDSSFSKFSHFKELLKDLYLDLVLNYYLNKKDVSEFLKKILYKEQNSYHANDLDVFEFVNYYYSLYKEIGLLVDESESKDKWLN